MRYALYKEVAKRRRQKRKKRKLNHGGASAGKGEDGSQDSSDEEDSSDDNDDDEEQPETVERLDMSKQQPNGGQPPAQSGSQNSLWQDDSQDVSMATVPANAGDPTRDGGVPPQRYVDGSSSQDTDSAPFSRPLSQTPVIPIKGCKPVRFAFTGRGTDFLGGACRVGQRRTVYGCTIWDCRSRCYLPDHDRFR